MKHKDSNGSNGAGMCISLHSPLKKPSTDAPQQVVTKGATGAKLAAGAKLLPNVSQPGVLPYKRTGAVNDLNATWWVGPGTARKR